MISPAVTAVFPRPAAAVTGGRLPWLLLTPAAVAIVLVLLVPVAIILGNQRDRRGTVLGRYAEALGDPFTRWRAVAHAPDRGDPRP